MTGVTLRPNESQDQLLRRFRKKVAQSGILSTVRRKRWFVSKSELRRIERKKAIRRLKRRQRKVAASAPERELSRRRGLPSRTSPAPRRLDAEAGREDRGRRHVSRGPSVNPVPRRSSTAGTRSGLPVGQDAQVLHPHPARGSGPGGALALRS